MPDTRVLSNKHRNIYLATEASAPFAQTPFQGVVTDDDFADFLDISSIVKWDETDLSVADPDTVDDRVLTDNATATLRGATNYGGGVQLLLPEDFNDTSDLAQQAWELLRQKNVRVWLIDRTVTPSATAPAVGQDVSVYLLLRDSKNYQKPEDASWGYVVQFLAQGTAYVKRLITDGTPAAISQVGYDTSVATGSTTWGKVSLHGRLINSRATYTLSDPSLAVVNNVGAVYIIDDSSPVTLQISYAGAVPVSVVINP